MVNDNHRLTVLLVRPWCRVLQLTCERYQLFSRALCRCHGTHRSHACFRLSLRALLLGGPYEKELTPHPSPPTQTHPEVSHVSRAEYVWIPDCFRLGITVPGDWALNTNDSLTRGCLKSRQYPKSAAGTAALWQFYTLPRGGRSWKSNLLPVMI